MSDSAAFTGVDLAEVAREISAHRQGARAVRCTGRIAALGVGLLWLVALFLGGAGSVGKAGRSGSVVPNGRVWPTGGAAASRRGGSTAAVPDDQVLELEAGQAVGIVAGSRAAPS